MPREITALGDLSVVASCRLPLIEDDARPLLLALAGPNGAGKSTFQAVHLNQLGIRFVNADLLSRELNIGAYAAAEIAEAVRWGLVQKRESFVFETVFSDPSGEKLALLQHAQQSGYQVVLLFIGLATAEESDGRVALRVSQGGHDVPPDKIVARFPRALHNLVKAVRTVNRVLIFDNTNLAQPFREIASFRNGDLVSRARDLPAWFEQLDFALAT
jgi:predicted ABC-type ATPase